MENSIDIERKIQEIELTKDKLDSVLSLHKYSKNIGRNNYIVETNSLQKSENIKFCDIIYKKFLTSIIKQNSNCLTAFQYTANSICQNNRKMVIDKLLNNNIDGCDLDCILFSNNSSSILNVFILAKTLGITTVYIVLPAYSCVSTYSKMLNFNLRFIKLSCKNFKIEAKDLYSIEENSLVVVTSPVLFTGELLNNESLQLLNSLIPDFEKRHIYVLFDESLSLNKNRLANKLIDVSSNTIFIYSPYKNININGFLKFSAVLSKKQTIDAIYKNAECFAAAFVNQNYLAKSVEFFLSTYYDMLYTRLIKYSEETFIQLKSLCTMYDKTTMPDMFNCTMTSICIDKDIKMTYELSKKMLVKHKLALYPSSCEILNTNKFYFRINLLLDKTDVIYNAKQIIQHVIDL